MTRLVSCPEAAAVYLVIAGALIGTALSALDRFYPICQAGRRVQPGGLPGMRFRRRACSPSSQPARFAVDPSLADRERGQDARRA
jgi:hypothetical protein